MHFRSSWDLGDGELMSQGKSVGVCSGSTPCDLIKQVPASIASNGLPLNLTLVNTTMVTWMSNVLSLQRLSLFRRVDFMPIVSKLAHRRCGAKLKVIGQNCKMYLKLVKCSFWKYFTFIDIFNYLLTSAGLNNYNNPIVNQP